MTAPTPAPFRLGKTLYQGQTVPTGADLTYSTGLLGREQQFDHQSVPTSFGPIVRDSQRSVHAILVRNESGINLLGGYLVTFTVGSEGKSVDGYATTTAVKCAGIVDPFLPTAGVRDDDCFWLIVRGPALCKTSLAADAENVISAGSVLYALTAATSQATTAGRVQAWGGTHSSTSTTDGTASNILLNRLGRAMSAKTTANTNADALVDLDIDRR